jgi:hypothetical protein
VSKKQQGFGAFVYQVFLAVVLILAGTVIYKTFVAG